MSAGHNGHNLKRFRGEKLYDDASSTSNLAGEDRIKDEEMSAETSNSNQPGESTSRRRPAGSSHKSMADVTLESEILKLEMLRSEHTFKEQQQKLILESLKLDVEIKKRQLNVL